jgi:hypothetical protein
MKVKLTLTTIIECNENAEELKKNKDYINGDGKFTIDHMSLTSDDDDDSFYVFDLVDAEDVI